MRTDAAPLAVRRARSGTPWKRVQAQVFREETHCFFCGGWVDQSISDYNAAEARSVHHIRSPRVAPDLVLDRTNLALAHRSCNWRAGEGGGTLGLVRPPSRPWT